MQAFGKWSDFEVERLVCDFQFHAILHGADAVGDVCHFFVYPAARAAWATE